MKTATEVFKDIKIFSENAEFIPTGFQKLDTELDGGFMKKELIVIGGYTGSGKSYISGQILFNAAKKGFKSAYFSLEIANEMIVARLIGSEANIKPTLIMKGFLTPEENDTRIKAQGLISAYDNQLSFVDDKYQLFEICKLIRENKFEFVVIDFIQNIMDKGDEYEKLSKVSLEFQKLAKECNCCILVVSQLSNDAFKTGALEYKGSGSIATVCDLGMFLTRDEESIDRLELKVKKNRRGRSGISVPLQSVYPGGKIHEL